MRMTDGVTVKGDEAAVVDGEFEFGFGFGFGFVAPSSAPSATRVRAVSTGLWLVKVMVCVVDVPGSRCPKDNCSTWGCTKANFPIPLSFMTSVGPSSITQRAVLVKTDAEGGVKATVKLASYPV